MQHIAKVTVLQSNIIYGGICCFNCASLQINLEMRCKLRSFLH